MSTSYGLRKVRPTDVAKIISISRPYIEKYGDTKFKATESSLRNIFTSLLQSPFFLCAERDNEIVAWMAASAVSPHPYSDVSCLTQNFYHTILEGVHAFRLCGRFHTRLFDFAETHGYEMVCSSSFLENKQVFYRVLEKQGWEITNRGAVKMTKNHRSYNG